MTATGPAVMITVAGALVVGIAGVEDVDEVEEDEEEEDDDEEVKDNEEEDDEKEDDEEEGVEEEDESEEVDVESVLPLVGVAAEDESTVSMQYSMPIWKSADFCPTEGFREINCAIVRSFASAMLPQVSLGWAT